MTNKAISPLRRRMTFLRPPKRASRRRVEDMTIRKFAPKTQSNYIRSVGKFTQFLGRSPDRARAEDLRRYQLLLSASGVSAPGINATVSALRFFFSVTLGRGDAIAGMTTLRAPRKLPVILSPREVARLLDAAPSLKYPAALSLEHDSN